MKKRISLILTVALLMSAIAMLASCAHECSFETAWTHDANNHWHVCEDEKCDLTTTPEAHTWNDGAITTAATQEAAGIKTYTCTVCAATKTEPVEFTGLTKTEWDTVVSAESFSNFSMLIAITGESNGVTVTQSINYKFGAEKLYMCMTMGDESHEEYLEDAEDVAETKAQLAEMMLEMFKYDNFTYDKEAKLYRAKGAIKIAFDGSEPTNTTARFENGKLVEVKYSYDREEAENVTVTMNTTITFSDYGTTVVEVPAN